MTNLQSLLDVDNHDRMSMIAFIDYNALIHQTVFDALLGRSLITPHFPLFIEGGEVTDDWKYAHFAEHLAWSRRLNLASPPDLIDADFADDNQFADWQDNHFLHHQLVARTLNL